MLLIETLVCPVSLHFGRQDKNDLLSGMFELLYLVIFHSKFYFFPKSFLIPPRMTSSCPEFLSFFDLLTVVFSIKIKKKTLRVQTTLH